MFWFDKERSLVKCALNEWSQKDCIRCAGCSSRRPFQLPVAESRIPSVTPLRPVREMVDIALSELSGQTSLDSAGEVVAGIAAADPVFDSQ